MSSSLKTMVFQIGWKERLEIVALSGPMELLRSRPYRSLNISGVISDEASLYQTFSSKDY